MGAGSDFIFKIGRSKVQFIEKYTCHFKVYMLTTLSQQTLMLWGVKHLYYGLASPISTRSLGTDCTSCLSYWPWDFPNLRWRWPRRYPSPRKRPGLSHRQAGSECSYAQVHTSIIAERAGSVKSYFLSINLQKIFIVSLTTIYGINYTNRPEKPIASTPMLSSVA